MRLFFLVWHRATLLYIFVPRAETLSHDRTMLSVNFLIT